MDNITGYHSNPLLVSHASETLKVSRYIGYVHSIKVSLSISRANHSP